MKTYLIYLTCLSVLAGSAFAQGTAFTYQGRLNEGGVPANGNYDLRFMVWNAATGPSLVSGTVGTNALAVTNGLFTVTLDFGPGIFTGANRWLEINVRTNGSGSFATLGPRQLLTATPYAITAGNVTGIISSASVAGTYSNPVAFTNLANTFAGNGNSLSNVNAATLGGLDGSSFWKTAGNSGTTPGANFIGTSDNQPLLIRGGFVGVGRATPITVAEYFGLEAPTDDWFGGMYINTRGRGGLPFYGYAQAGNPTVYHYVDGSDGDKWKLFVGDDRIVVTQDGHVGIGTVVPTNRLSVLGSVSVVNTEFGGGITLHNGSLPTAYYIHDDSGERAAFGFANGPGAYSADADTGDIVLRALNSKLLLQSGAGSAAITVSTNNNVGIGTNAPAEKLHVEGNVLANGILTVRGGLMPDFPVVLGIWAEAGGSVIPGLVVPCAVLGQSAQGYGVYGVSSGPRGLAAGVYGGGIGLTPGVGGGSHDGNGVEGNSTRGNGVQGTSNSSGVSGVYGENLASGGIGVAGRAAGTGRAVFGDNSNASGWAGYFNGNVRVTGSINPSSDRNVKAGFQVVDSKAILEKVAALPITRWHYTNDMSTPHIGPVAQDFHTAFSLGRDDKHISTVDADGVALAAIQGLHTVVREKEARIEALEKSLAELKQIVTKLTEENRP